MMGIILDACTLLGIFVVLGVLYGVLFFTIGKCLGRLREKKNGGEKENDL